MSKHPLVSIVVPSFNQGQFIKETIDSILYQDYRPIEVIVIDACSTDNTKEVLGQYSSIPEVSWTSEPDRGQADGVNKGFSRARGEIVGWLNADDVYFSISTISTVVSFFEKFAEIDVFYGDVAIISKRSTLLRLFLVPPYKKSRILRRNFICQPAVFFRRDVVHNEMLDNEQVGLDYEYWLRLVLLGYRFRHVSKILACDRHYPERTSVQQKALIESQIARVKDQLGIVKTENRKTYYADRFHQAICRIMGFFRLIVFPFVRGNQVFAFPLYIDSFWKLLLRQLLKARDSNFEF